MIRQRYVALLGLWLSASLAFAKPLSLLVLSDIHLNSHVKHQMDFEPEHVSPLNDMDLQSFEAMLETIKRDISQGRLDKPDYLIVLGDLVGHFRTAKDSVNSAETLVFQEIKHQFPQLPVLYSFGNNDSFTKNYGPFSSVDQTSPLSIAKTIWSKSEADKLWLMSAKACQTKPSSPCLLDSNDKQGYYAAYLAKNLRVISLNTVLFSGHVADDDELKAAQAQLAWLGHELDAAQTAKDSVLLLMHIPPGEQLIAGPWIWSSNAFWRKAELQAFLKLTSTYQATLMGILAGHTHKDEIKMIHHRASNQQTGIYINAAMASIYANAPSIRTYMLEQGKGAWILSNYRSYRFERQADKTLKLNFLYDFRERYCSYQKGSINLCLTQVNERAMQQFYTAGNPNFSQRFQYPKNRLIEAP